MAHVRIFKRGDRGFHGYGTPLKCTYGTTMKVYESSSAEGPHVWLNVEVNHAVLSRHQPGEASAHLNKKQAQALINRLQTWIDEIPSRWGRRVNAK